MKTIKKIAILIVVIALMCGCTMKETITLNISANKKAKVNMLMVMDNEMIDSLMSMGNLGSDSSEKKTYTDVERWAYLEGDDSSLTVPKGFTVEKYDKDGFKGWLATKELGTLDEISTETATKRVNIVENSDSEDAKILEGKLFIKDGNKYKSNMTVDMGDSSEQMTSYESYGAVFNVEFVLELPVKPSSNNATKVSEDGKTLTYDLFKTKDIDFEFELSENSASTDTKIVSGTKASADTNESGSTTSSNSNLMLYVGIGAGALVLILIIALATKKKPAQELPAQPVQPVQPVEPIQPVQPIEAAQPVQPMEPVQPVEPIQPVQPVEPIQPVQPVEPIQPVQPVEPTVPVQPIEPAQPVEPVQNIQPEVPNNINNQM